MELMDVNRLIPHPKNSYFFDDMDGQPWSAFIDSIQTSGIIEPIVATQNLVIISGHQRVRAAKRLNIEKVPVEIRVIDSEDEILKQLIETNIRQRGVGNTNPVKFGLCLKELDRIYGVRDGSAGGTGANQYTKEVQVQNAPQATKKDIAGEIGISVDAYKRYESLTNLIPEISDMVDNGITMTSAVAIARKLSPEEQALLAEQISGKEKVSGSEVKKYIDEIQSMKEENAKLRNVISEQGVRNAKLQNELNQKVVEVKEVEVVPADYNTLKAKAKEADAWKKDYHKEQERVGEKNKEILELQDRIKRLQEQTVLEQNNQDMTASAIMFALQCRNFIEAVGGYVFISEHLNELPERERVGYLKAVQAVHDWSHILQENMERGNSELLTGH